MTATHLNQVARKKSREPDKTHACENNHKRMSALLRQPAGNGQSCDQYLRLNKAVARKSLLSRRKADELIFAGRIRVNGVVETNPGRRVSLADQIELDDKIVDARQEHIYVLMNKPVQCVCTRRDPQGRPTVMDFLPEDLKNRGLYPVGRLDYFSEGLLLLTNDGAFAQKMTHPSRHQARLYEVTVRGKVDKASLDSIRCGMELDGLKLLPARVTARPLSNGNTLLLMELRQGINRQIRRMCQKLNLTILRLLRIRQGCLALGGLKPGQTRLLDADEVAKMSCHRCSR